MRARTVVRCVVAMVAALALVVGFIPTAASATETGSIAGTVSLVDDTVPSWSRVCVERVTPEGGTVCGELAPDGSYQLDGLEPGEYFVWFQARTEVPCEAYFEEAYENNGSWDLTSLVPVTAGAVTAGIDAILATHLYGYVRDGQGRGVPGATVAAYADEDTWLPTGWTTTRADGMFELNDLLAGSYRLAVAAPSGSGYRWQWYGSPTGARGDATPQEVALCNEWNELGVTLDDAGSMAGTVFFATGAPAVGTRVAAYEQGVTWLPEAVVTTSADGTFAFDDLPVGSYQLLLTAPAGVNRPAVWLGGPRRGKATVHQVTAGGSITGVDATLPYDDDVPAQTLLSGTVQHESGTPAAGATVAAYGTTNGVLPHATVTVATDGTFAFDDLAPDTYRLLVRAPSGPETTLTQYWHAEPGETDRSRSAAAAIEVPADDDVTGVTVVYPSS